ncbi:perforin-1.3 [Halichoeres trimaculatus]|uniref:perforin-1.3 n=1 Tax=Halichoeres trimaculatus TaxID=147232 RepID=UPI003D9F072D
MPQQRDTPPNKLRAFTPGVTLFLTRIVKLFLLEAKLQTQVGGFLADVEQVGPLPAAEGPAVVCMSPYSSMPDLAQIDSQREEGMECCLKNCSAMFFSPRRLLFLLLFLLIFLPHSYGCQTSHFTECQNAPFVPGHNLAGEGFDVVRLKTTGASVVDVKNYMVGGNEGNCTMCHNRLMNQSQKLPVSVLDWRIKVHCRRSLSSKIFESSQSVMKETSKSLGRSWKVGLSLPGIGGFAVGGSHSTSSSFAESRSRKDKFSFTTHDFQCKYYTFRLHSRPALSKEFEVSLKNLPSTHHHLNTSAFKQFISVYGTHFIRRVQLGGRVNSITAIRTCEAAISQLSTRTVSNCLSVEARATIKGISAGAETKFCRSKGKSLKTGSTFSQAFSDRTTEILGGDGDVGDILFAPNSAAGYKKWLKSLKAVPGVVSYQISPLHQLVTDNPVLQTSLRDAISHYIRTSAKPLRCPAGCKVGSQNRNCACHCKGHRMVNAECCPSENGVARMNVTVVRASGLWGDYFSKTDGYVKVFYGNEGAVTPVIWNNDFPTWNYLIRFETVNLRFRRSIRFEVWDRDNRWNDDLLGRVLQGSLCEQYAPSPTYGDVMGYPKEDREDHWGSGRSDHDSTIL